MSPVRRTVTCLSESLSDRLGVSSGVCRDSVARRADKSPAFFGANYFSAARAFVSVSRISLSDLESLPLSRDFKKGQLIAYAKVEILGDRQLSRPPHYLCSVSSRLVCDTVNGTSSSTRRISHVIWDADRQRRQMH